MKDLLNSQQWEAVHHIEGPLLLLSGAGSGKTKVITHRIAHLIEKGVLPYNILAITFTNKAAKEMKSRLNNLLSGQDSVRISTFHSFCVRILRENINKLNYSNNFTIYDSSNSLSLIKESIKILQLDEKIYQPQNVTSAISKLKDNMLTPSDYEKEAIDTYEKKISEIYTNYQRSLKKNNALDFDDIIIKAIDLFNQEGEILLKYQEKFKYIMVDEYQDTNLAQYTLINLLSKSHKNLCVVGDDDQSIYGWRGANIKNILNFENDYPGAKVIKLEQNYRSTKFILEAANCVIENNISRKSKSLWTNKEDGNKVNYISVTNDAEEAALIGKIITQNKLNFSNIAVLYRKNALSRSIEDQFVKSNIPYKVYGGLRFYDRKEIKDILSYLISIYNPNDSIAIKRIINIPKRGIGNISIDKISKYANDYNISFYEALKNAENIGIKTKKINEFLKLIESLQSYDGSVSSLIKKVLEITNYKNDLSEDPIELESRLENIGELINKAISFEQSAENPTLSTFLEEVTLVSDIDNHEVDSGYVSLMTIHSAKGLEFPIVFLIGFEEGIFPSIKSFTKEKELEEERRLCYVAITRAIETLYITSANSRLQNGRIIHSAPSRFLKEIPHELINDNRAEHTSKPIKGISRYAEIKIFTDTKSPKSNGKNYKIKMPIPKNVDINFKIGDTVRQEKYGNGTVKEIYPAGADYEVTIDFNGKIKKFMAKFSNLTKV